MATRKIFLIVCDGMGDRPVEGRTPLEAANTPNMDLLAKVGINGLMDPVRAGVRPGSDTSHLSLFGYDPFKIYTGRGPFEAYGAGIDMQKGDVAIRANFATMKDDKVIDRRAGREEEGLDELADKLDGLVIDDVEITFKRGKGHRAVIVLRGVGLSSNISETDPEGINYSIRKVAPLDDDGKSRKTADVMNKFLKLSQDLLANSEINTKRVKNGKPPANVILTRGPGTKPDIIPFSKKYRLKPVCVCATTLVKGVCRSMGMEIAEVPGANGHVDSDIEKKTRTALASLESHDLVFLHIKGADEASHDMDFDLKTRMLERIDGMVIEHIINKVDIENTTIALTADHSTPVNIGQHSADPVPVVIAGDVRTDHVERFTERECAHGGLGRINGMNLMDILMDLSNRSNLFGA